ncbi:BREX-1 system adenine-specific DNA-methyltransferase PglX [Bifidobacterium stellenboschense]|uniref:site-specific DNA-methyltransferase (adenine-specific) n=1 Tax=Bifidobacterium stellenboschense TaxID=762211 RepID=A0A087E0N6_9BIFI|nr:BREX-1 system adenine-specific DNA-methyltransferase PglX [Bifidobacterium stellenboschense]KFJ01337.1 type II restriction endonuclease [Bifidobacterium stellenboschense]
MNTNRLQGFAAEARVELIRAVRAKLDAAMEPDSAARVDDPGAFARLMEEIRQAGGGEQGRARTAERHAYRWFNRIIALRYMDANGFTSPHVVSGDDADDPNALPEVLSAAKRGEFDEDVFGSTVGAKSKLMPTIVALLDGSKPSNDPQGDAYGLLLRAYCDYWHRFLPFMFDEAGAADGILMPADLLASDSILRKAVTAMPVSDCVGSSSAPSDEGAVAEGDWGRDSRRGTGNVEIIGWLYQFYIADRKDEVMAGFKKSKKAGAAEIPAATQLFTPDWIVRYLVQNTVGRLWTQSHPESQLWKSWAYYIPAPAGEERDLPPLAGAGTRSVTGGGHGGPEKGELLRIDTPEDLTVCDPACGSGHMLTYAFDLLYDIYDESGYSANEIPGLILKHNLYGMEIDERAANLAAFALTMKARGRYRRFFRKGRQVQPNIQRITPEYFTESEVEELNELYDVTFDAETWNTYQHADIYGSLIQPPTDLVALLPLAGAVEQSETEGGQPMLLAPDLLDRAHTILTQTAYLTRKYAAVVANPPYMGAGNMGDLLKKWLTKNYKAGSKDLMTAFMLKASQMVVHDGYWGMINLPSWISLSSFENLRAWLLSTCHIDSFIDMGRGIFGSDFGSVAFVIHNTNSDGRKGYYRRLFEKHVDVRPVKTIESLFLDKSYNVFTVDQQDFAQIPGSPIVYWLSDAMRKTFVMGKPFREISNPRGGLQTSDNNRFIRDWWESCFNAIGFGFPDRKKASNSNLKWFPYNKGGAYCKWYGNEESIVNWQNDGGEIKRFICEKYSYLNGNFAWVAKNMDDYFAPSISWSLIGSGETSFRYYPTGNIFDHASGSFFGDEAARRTYLAILNSSVAGAIIAAIAPTLNANAGLIGQIPFISIKSELDGVGELVFVSKSDWDSYETSWDFAGLEMLRDSDDAALSDVIPAYIERCKTIAEEQRQREIRNNELVADAYGVRDEVPCDVPIERVSLKRNPAFAYPKATPAERDELMARDVVKEIISYAVGCMFGRYSLDKPGLILASQGETLDYYHAQIPNPSFAPDADNVIPVTDDEWFEDDIVTRFRDFLAVACGEKHLSENITYIEQVLGKPLRKYFAMDFYDDHVKMYKNRPIYWMYSSRTDNKGAFKALVYLHRYTPATTNTVLKYLREFAGKLTAQSEALLASSKAAEARKGEKLRAAVKECDDYERDVLYPLATRNLPIDLDDGVLVNYLRMGKALRTIKPIEAKRKTVQSWTWPTNPLEV